MEQWQVGPLPDYIYGNSANHPNDVHAQHPYQQHMTARRNDQPMDFRYGQQPPQAPGQQHHTAPGQPPLSVPPQHQAPHAPHPGQQHQQPPQQHQQHQQPPQQHQQPPQQQQHQQAPPASQQQPSAAAPNSAASTPVAQRARKRPNPATAQQPLPAATPATSASPIIPPPIPTTTAAASSTVSAVPAPAVPAGTPLTKPPTPASATAGGTPIKFAPPAEPGSVPTPPAKKSRTNTPWTPAEEHRLKQMRDAGSSWAEIAKTFPTRTEGSVKKHWYKDMHYAEFAEDESQALLNAIKEYENQKWKVIGQKVGKPAKACEQYAKEHFADQVLSGSGKR